MIPRDKAIIDDLSRFRCLTRDHVAAIHFKGLKQPITQANAVLKRLRRDSYVNVSMDRRKYVYFPAPSTMKKDSAKIPHFLAIADFYVDICKHEKPYAFQVEPKLGDKGFPEPDVFMIWKGNPFFVEIQRSNYTEKIMADKFKRYEHYYLTDKWHSLPWQPKEKAPIFPRLWVLSDSLYSIVTPYRLYQTKTVDEIFSKIPK